MKSEVIEYIKNNTYIEELFLDFRKRTKYNNIWSF